jgi:putative Mg2+ transporter-C (MgtC) family protein
MLNNVGIFLKNMPLEAQFTAIFNLFLTGLLSGLVGLDRERLDRPAGLRTHMMVGLGACLFTLLSAYAFPGSDPARIASQIVVGIGFLGAGTILKREATGEVHALTTAASIWATAAIGMAVGSGAWFLAIGATLIIWFVLSVMRRFENGKTSS